MPGNIGVVAQERCPAWTQIVFPARNSASVQVAPLNCPKYAVALSLLKIACIQSAQEVMILVHAHLQDNLLGTVPLCYNQSACSRVTFNRLIYQYSKLHAATPMLIPQRQIRQCHIVDECSTATPCQGEHCLRRQQ